MGKEVEKLEASQIHCFSMSGIEAWYIDSSDEDQRKPHRLNPNQPVSLEELKKIGVLHWK
eukprot:superscaffoldBa00001135_g9117